MFSVISACLIAPMAFTAPVAGQPCEWSALGRGPDEGVFAMTTFDDGGGEALYIGGDFTAVETIIARHVARWNGRSWAALGAGVEGGLVFSLAVFDDGLGGGPALYAGGSFETSGGEPVRGIAKWDGVSWTEVGGGISEGPFPKPRVSAMCVFDDGSGPALYVGGDFGSAGGVGGTSAIAKWDGQEWSPVGRGVGIAVHALTVFDDGSGPALYAGGTFRYAGGAVVNHIAMWDGSSWSEVGGGADDHVFALGVFDDGGGRRLYAGGRFLAAGGTPARSIAKWDGSFWSEVGGGLDKFISNLASLDDGSGPALYVGGAFTMAGGEPIHDPVKWDGQRWVELHGAGAGLIALSASVYTVFDDGHGPALYAAGAFEEEPGWWQLGFRQYIARLDCPTCYADCDISGELDFWDCLCFQNAFAAGDPHADCDRDGRLTFFDLLCFENGFVAGCP